MKFVLACALTLLTVPVFAQQRGAPADVPPNHWAFKAVDDLFRAGILQGYPDGTFKGDRPVSRYELASVLAALNSAMILPQVPLAPQLATRADLDQFSQAISSLRSQVETLKTDLHSASKDLKSQNATMDDLHRQIEELKKQIGG